MPTTKAPKKTVVVMETDEGIYEPAYEAETPGELLAEMFRFIREQAEPEIWVATKDGDFIRWGDVRLVRLRESHA